MCVCEHISSGYWQVQHTSHYHNNSTFQTWRYINDINMTDGNLIQKQQKNFWNNGNSPCGCWRLWYTTMSLKWLSPLTTTFTAASLCITFCDLWILYTERLLVLPQKIQFCVQSNNTQHKCVTIYKMQLSLTNISKMITPKIRQKLGLN